MTVDQMKMLMELIGVKDWTLEHIDHKVTEIKLTVHGLSLEKTVLLGRYLSTHTPAPFKLTVELAQDLELYSARRGMYSEREPGSITRVEP